MRLILYFSGLSRVLIAGSDSFVALLAHCLSLFGGCDGID